MGIVKEDPDGWGEAHSTCQEKQQPTHQVAACTIDQTLGQFDVGHRGPESRVTHSDQAVTAPVVSGALHPQACVNSQVLLISVECDQSQFSPVGKQSPRKEACYRGDATQEGEHCGCMDVPTAHGRQAGWRSTAGQTRG